MSLESFFMLENSLDFDSLLNGISLPDSIVTATATASTTSSSATAVSVDVVTPIVQHDCEPKKMDGDFLDYFTNYGEHQPKPSTAVGESAQEQMIPQEIIPTDVELEQYFLSCFTQCESSGVERVSEKRIAEAHKEEYVHEHEEEEDEDEDEAHSSGSETDYTCQRRAPSISSASESAGGGKKTPGRNRIKTLRSGVAPPISEEKLVSMGIKELNRFLDSYTPEQGKEIKELRRRLKNRDAANVCRFKRSAKTEGLAFNLERMSKELLFVKSQYARLRELVKLNNGDLLKQFDIEASQLQADYFAATMA